MGDSWKQLATGMMLVLEMSIQNAAHRMYLNTAPPTTLMTGSTTQIMLNLADAARGQADETSKRRMARMSRAVLAFAAGYGLAALPRVHIGLWAFVVPPRVSLIGQGLARPYPN